MPELESDVMEFFYTVRFDLDDVSNDYTDVEEAYNNTCTLLINSVLSGNFTASLRHHDSTGFFSKATASRVPQISSYSYIVTLPPAVDTEDNQFFFYTITGFSVIAVGVFVLLTVIVIYIRGYYRRLAENAMLQYGAKSLFSSNLDEKLITHSTMRENNLEDDIVFVTPRDSDCETTSSRSSKKAPRKLGGGRGQTSRSSFVKRRQSSSTTNPTTYDDEENQTFEGKEYNPPVFPAGNKNSSLQSVDSTLFEGNQAHSEPAANAFNNTTSNGISSKTKAGDHRSSLSRLFSDEDLAEIFDE